MNKNPLEEKLAIPYTRALYDFSIEQNLMHQITADFQNLDIFLQKTPELVDYLNNPLVIQEQKQELLNKILKSELNQETFKFLSILIKRNRIYLLTTVITSYLNWVYNLASIKTIQVNTASAFTILQKNTLIKKLKELTNAREIRLIIDVDSSLIGGFLIKTNSKVIDFTIKNQLQLLAKHLDSFIEI